MHKTLSQWKPYTIGMYQGCLMRKKSARLPKFCVLPSRDLLDQLIHRTVDVYLSESQDIWEIFVLQIIYNKKIQHFEPRAFRQVQAGMWTTTAWFAKVVNVWIKF